MTEAQELSERIERLESAAGLGASEAPDLGPVRRLLDAAGDCWGVKIVDLNSPVRSLREAAELNQAELAVRMGVDPSRISHLERQAGQDGELKLSTLRRAAEACGFTIQILATPKAD